MKTFCSGVLPRCFQTSPEQLMGTFQPVFGRGGGLLLAGREARPSRVEGDEQTEAMTLQVSSCPAEEAAQPGCSSQTQKTPDFHTEQSHRWKSHRSLPGCHPSPRPDTAQTGSAHMWLQTLFQGYPNLTTILLEITEWDAKLQTRVGLSCACCD